MADKKKPAAKRPENPAAIARTEARKAKNRAENQRRYEANRLKAEELGLAPATREKTITKVVKKGKKTFVNEITIVKSLSPAELLRKHAREMKDKFEVHEYNAREAQIKSIEERLYD